MRSRSRLARAGLFFFLLVSSAAAAAELDAVLARAMQGSSTPAMGAVLIRNGTLSEIAVRGVRANNGSDPVTAQDAWLLGSTSKPMTAAMIARLVERGTLRWDAPLASMLPQLADSMREEYRGVTLLQLLSHGAGLPENLRELALIDPYFVDARPLPEQRMAYIATGLRDAPVDAAERTFSYSNTGFLIAAVIAEQATKKPFEALMQEQVFAPLGMDSAGFGPPTDGQPRGHRGGKPAGPPRKNDDGVPMMFGPAGNMHMSLADWGRFCVDQLAGARGKGRLLSPASYALMQSPRAGGAAGLDWGVQARIAGRQGPVLTHGGSDGNWLAWVALFPASGNGVLVIANAADDMGADQATHAALAELLPTLAPAVDASAPAK